MASVELAALFDRHDVPAAVRAFLVRPRQNLINGQWHDAVAGGHMNVYEPSTGGVVAAIAASTAEDVAAAVAAAHRAHEDGRWSGLTPDVREGVLRRFAALLEADAPLLAMLETIDNGQPIAMASGVNIPDAIKFAHYMAGWPTKIDGRTVPLSFPGRPWGLTRREPVGVVAAITPWNLPFNMAVQKVFPALAAGCPVILKPAEQTSLTALRMGELAMEAGLPDGVLNIVTGTGAAVGEALITHPDVRKISFTGSTQVGQRIGKLALDNLTRVTLELGGKSPMVVLADADLDQAAQGVIDGIFFNAGQVCCAASRLFVQSSISERLLERVVALAEGLRIGPGLDPETQLGPLVSAAHRDRVQSYVDLATLDGGRMLTGGAWQDAGYFARPTVFAGLSAQSRAVREEIFGPVVVAATFDTTQEALMLANDTRYGLGASVWSQNLAQVQPLVEGIRAGTVWVNAHNLVDPALPFGGIGMSGIGREGGPETLDAFLETKAVWLSAGVSA